MLSGGPRIERIEVRVFTVPTDAPESDATLDWNRTTVVVVEAEAARHVGIGYTYSAAGAGSLVHDTLIPAVTGQDAFAIPRHWAAMVAAVRNIGRAGLSSTAISAVDTALWDLKARVLGVPLVQLLGAERPAVPIYGSGGFTNHTPDRLRDQLGHWVDELGCRWVKMKVGRDAVQDRRRVAEARVAVGDAGLMVDANGGYTRKAALAQAETFTEHGVSWFEEPVSSDDLEGLRLLRDRIPAPMEIAAGEYAYDPIYVRRMLDAGAVDVMQLDATRCCGITGFLRASAVADAHGIPLSAHTAPALHLAVCCAVPRLRHLEWFHDHARLEHMIFDGAPEPRAGAVRPDLTRPGNGLELKRRDASRFAA